MRILIAENREFLAKVYESFLVKAGYEVYIEPDGERALYRMRESKPDLVLLDLKMPEKDGFEVLEERMTDPELKKIPVIVFSALEKEGLIERVKKLGADDYLHKAEVQVELLLEKIEKLLEQKK